ncbi:Vacuolar fusion protein mon1 [Coemansia sp. RSA 2673]|nr:Vacuolar fusion protein mon1 [Coemansia sp. RSA 2673]
MSDPVRSMAVGAHTIVFYTNGPLYLLAASDRGDPPELLRNELQLLHSQIVSILTSAQLTKIFEQRSNFDLRQLLGGTEVIIDHLVDKLDTDLSFALGSLDTLWIRLAPFIQHGHVPHWMPMCFPRFNDQGFLHAYLNYISPNVALILVSADRDSFAAMTQCRERICEDLAVDDSLQRLDDAASQRALHPSELGVSGLLQLYYRNKTLVQHFGTRFDVSVAEDQKGRIINTYKRLRLYMAGGSSNPLRIIYYKREEDTVLAWQSSSFELYATVAPAMEVKAMIRLVNSVLEWIKNEEDHLFVINAPSY